MTKFFAIAAAAAFLALTGCENNHNHSKMSSTDQMKPAMMQMDACPACPGKQTVTADGKCSGCGAPVADVCSHCPGVQVATMDGKCPGCGAKVK